MKSQIKKERLYSGIYSCMYCNTEYEIKRATKDELICEECKGELIWIDEDDEEEE